jgi:hypothetical protein
VAAYGIFLLNRVYHVCTYRRSYSERVRRDERSGPLAMKVGGDRLKNEYYLVVAEIFL